MLGHINKSNSLYVKKLQKDLGLKQDGILGPKTLSAAKEHFGCEVISYKGELVPLNNSADYVVEHDLSLYELPDGTKNWRYRKNDPETICMHWGGLNARHCYMVFYNTKSNHVSSHFLIGRDPRDGNRIEIIQCLDAALVAYHAGKFNSASVGIDICQHPDVKWEKKSKSFGYETEVIDNIGARGPKQMMSLDPELAYVAREFIKDLRTVLKLDDKPILTSEETLSIHDLTDYSIVSHCNVSKKKWDICATWAKDLHWKIAEEENNS